jgi:hypothetical protein
MRVQRRVWLIPLVIAATVGVGWLGLLAFAAAFQQALVGPEHEFVLPNRPAFLTEELAIAYAREALARDVRDPAGWELSPPRQPTTAPDGRKDIYLSRNTHDPNRGSLRFLKPGGGDRFVSIELRGDRMICQGAWGK